MVDIMTEETRSCAIVDAEAKPAQVWALVLDYYGFGPCIYLHSSQEKAWARLIAIVAERWDGKGPPFERPADDDEMVEAFFEGSGGDTYELDGPLSIDDPTEA